MSRHKQPPKPTKYCVDCGKVIHFKSTRCTKCASDYKWAHMDPETLRNMAVKAKAQLLDQWANNRDAMLERSKSEHFHQVVSDNMKKLWADPDNSIHVSVHEANIKMWSDPNFKKRMSDKARAQIIEQWKDPKFRLLRSERAKKQWTNAKFRKARSENASICTRARWSDPNNILHERLATISKRLWADPKYRYTMAMCLKRQLDDPDSAMRQGMVNSLRHRNNALEQYFMTLLDDAQVNYIYQYKPVGYARIYDFLLPDYNILIEVDGKYYHHSARAIAKKAPEADAEKDDWATTHGYDIVRIPEHGMNPNIVIDWLIPVVLMETANG